MKKIVTRLMLYISGLFLLALGVALSIKSNTGVSPVSSIPVVVYEITGLSVGTLTIIFFIACILLQILILRKDYRPRDLLQIVFSTIFGVFTDLALFLLQDLHAPNYLGQLVILGISIVVAGAGVFLIITTDIIVTAPDGLCLAISKKWDISYSSVKPEFDILCVSVAVILALSVLGNLSQIREGTILSALSTGRVVGILQNKYSDKVKRLFVDEKPPDSLRA